MSLEAESRYVCSTADSELSLHGEVRIAAQAEAAGGDGRRKPDSLRS